MFSLNLYLNKDKNLEILQKYTSKQAHDNPNYDNLQKFSNIKNVNDIDEKARKTFKDIQSKVYLGVYNRFYLMAKICCNQDNAILFLSKIIKEAKYTQNIMRERLIK